MRASVASPAVPAGGVPGLRQVGYREGGIPGTIPGSDPGSDHGIDPQTGPGIDPQTGPGIDPQESLVSDILV